MRLFVCGPRQTTSNGTARFFMIYPAGLSAAGHAGQSALTPRSGERLLVRQMNLTRRRRQAVFTNEEN
ncbi:MAG: hypothetical protein KDI53_08980 [Candidatus Accumulibacter sp.]|nr:hypothetical protein [Accumulibacter sp.]